jgi:8-oxo-dGTP diphosphatase
MLTNREYPRQPFPAVGAVIKDNDRILLVKRRNEPSQGKWSIPGGVVELGETIRAAVKREMEEEVSLQIEPEDIVDVIDNIVYDENGKVRYHYIITDFMARLTGGELKTNFESTRARWFKSYELIDLDMTNTTRRLLKKIRFF